MIKVKKYMSILLFTFFAFFLSFGCTEKTNVEIELENELVAGRTYALNVNVEKGLDTNLTITLSKEGIIHVDEKNKTVEALAEGSVELTASINDKISSTVTIIVKPAIKYTIEYELDGGISENLPSEYDTLNKGLDIPSPTKEGYKFLGWYDNNLFTGEKITKIEKGTEGNKILYAKWEKENITYKITFESNGGSHIQQIEYVNESEEITLENPTKERYKFLGWYDNNLFTGDKITKIEKGTAKNLTLYAKWEKENITYKITFESNGGSYVQEIEYVNESEEITLESPTKEGYKFIGWYDNNLFTGDKITKIEKGTAKNLTLYAKWEKEVRKLDAPLITGTINENTVKITFTRDDNAKSYTAIVYKDNIQYSIIENFNSDQEIVFSRRGTYQIKVQAKGDKINYLDSDYSNEYTMICNIKVLYVSQNKDDDYKTLDEAIKNCEDGFTIMLEKGTYDLTIVINKSVVIKGKGINNTTINVKKDVAGNLNAKTIEFDGVTLRGTGGEATTTGVYFQNGSNLTKFTVKNSHITSMNTFIKFVSESKNKININILNSKIDYIGQFLLWVTKSINEINLDGNVIDTSTCGAVANVNAALLRVRSGKAIVYNNEFISDVQAIDGLFECGVNGTLVSVKYNTFKNVTKYVHINDGKEVEFDKNLYLDVNGKSLSEVPTQVTGNGVKIGSLVTSDDARLNAYLDNSNTKFILKYDLQGGRFEENVSKIYDSEVGLDILPIPVKENHAFLGWMLDGKIIEKLPKNILNDITLVASWKSIEGEIYMITYYTEKGEWPTRDAKDRFEIINSLLLDMYEWAKGSGYTGTFENYEKSIRDKLSKYEDINIRSTEIGDRAYEDGTTKYFLNIPKYYEKWNEFFKVFDKAMLKVNATQSFYKDTYATMVRLNQFIAQDWSTGKGNQYFGSFLPEMYKTVQIPEEIQKTYQSGQRVILPILTSKTGTKFLGWYETEDFKGSPVTEIKVTDYGNKSFYAKWEEETKVEKVTINQISELKRFETYKLEWNLNPSNASNKDVEFTSSNENVASVTSKTGLITAHTNGKTVITMKVFGNRELDVKFELEVYTPSYVTGKFVDNSYVVENETIKIDAEVNNSNDKIIWSTSDNSIAVVDENGVVTGLKAGNVVIKATSERNNDLVMEFTVTIISPSSSNILKFIASENNANIFTELGLTIGGTYDADIYGSVSKILNEKFAVNDKYYAVQQEKDSNGNYVKKNFGPVKDSTEFITVHYTGNMSKGADGAANASYFSNGGSGTSIHYVTGNDGIYSSLDEKFVGFHAGDGRDVKFEWNPTGVKYNTNDPKTPKWGISSDSYFTINGNKTTIKTPYDGPYKNSKGTITYPGNGQVTDSKWINNMGLAYKIVDGEYYMGTTWWCHTQILEGRICSKGGNNNSIGIESCVNQGSDLWYTWQKTAQLVADIMIRHNLDITRVVGHHFFSAKNCPQPMLENNLRIWHEFIKIVEAEYEKMTTYKDYEITFISNNPNIVDNRGRVISVPEFTTCVTYTVTVKKGNDIQKITLSSIVPGKYEM